jgi:UDPglucose 6-dehydrogenase
MKIGIIGSGFVGGAVKNAYALAGVETLVVDPLYSSLTVADLTSCASVFVCVPSPQSETGQCDTSILESVLEQLDDAEYMGPVISKVTAPPSVYKSLGEIYPNLIHAPEFLVAATAQEDYLKGEFAIIGGNAPFSWVAEEVIKAGQKNVKVTHFCSIEEASLVKYTINTFLATKVSFMNELYDFCESRGMSYDNISRILTVEPRLGNSHFAVPGPDGQRGFGGACFPKDTAALLFESGNSMTVLKAAVDKNRTYR